MNTEKSITIKGKELRYSSKISLDEKDDSIVIHIHNTVANMQEDSSNFESIIISIWSVDRNITITLKFDSYTGKYDKNPKNRNSEWTSLTQPYYLGKNGKAYAEPARLHYMRFLYRVMRFRSKYQGRGFVIDNSNIEEVDKFEKLYTTALQNGELWITKPTVEGGIKGYDKESDSISYTGKIAENHLEKWFMIQSKNNNLPPQVANVFGNNRLFDQLPCCMFIGEPSGSTRIFNAGYFDLWGINDNNELCVFELKREGNVKLGIISELFFYAMLMKDMKEASKNKYPGIRSNHRGFGDFINHKSSSCVNAYFLVPELHSFLEDPVINKAFIDVLNEGESGVKFGLITFSQESIVGNNTEAFLKKLVSDLKKRPLN